MWRIQESLTIGASPVNLREALPAAQRLGNHAEVCFAIKGGSGLAYVTSAEDELTSALEIPARAVRLVRVAYPASRCWLHYSGTAPTVTPFLRGQS